MKSENEMNTNDLPNNDGVLRGSIPATTQRPQGRGYSRWKDLTNQRFGRLIAVRYLGTQSRKKACWECRCDCGSTCIVCSSVLINGATKSCGCYRKDVVAERARREHTTHGRTNTHVYRVWQGMKNRCSNPKVRDYDRYGGRGIVVCNRWATFANFLEDMGEPPSDDHWIERKDFDGNYEPGNCIWIPKGDQAFNRSSSLFIELNGERLCASQWDKRMGYRLGTVGTRFRKNGDAAAAILTPINTAKSRKQR